MINEKLGNESNKKNYEDKISNQNNLSIANMNFNNENNIDLDIIKGEPMNDDNMNTNKLKNLKVILN